MHARHTFCHSSFCCSFPAPGCRPKDVASQLFDRLLGRFVNLCLSLLVVGQDAASHAAAHPRVEHDSATAAYAPVHVHGLGVAPRFSVVLEHTVLVISSSITAPRPVVIKPRELGMAMSARLHARRLVTPVSQSAPRVRNRQGRVVVPCVRPAHRRARNRSCHRRAPHTRARIDAQR